MKWINLKNPVLACTFNHTRHRLSPNFGREAPMKIKNLFWILALGITTTGAFNTHHVTPLSLLLTIEFPTAIKEIPKLRVYHYSKHSANIVDTEVCSGALEMTIHEDSSCSGFGVLVTEQLEPPTKNNPTYISVDKGAPYKYYKINRASTAGPNEPQWIISEFSGIGTPSRIPENTVIVLVDPSLIEGLKPVTWKPHPGIVKLPNLVISKTITQEQLTKSFQETRLSALNIDPIHTKVAMAEQVLPTTVIRMARPRETSSYAV